MAKMTPKIQDAIDELEKAKNHTIKFTGEERNFEARRPFVALRDVKAVTYEIDKETGTRTVVLTKNYEAIIKKEFPIQASGDKPKKKGELARKIRIAEDAAKTEKVRDNLKSGKSKPPKSKPISKDISDKAVVVGKVKPENVISAIGPTMPRAKVAVPFTPIQSKNLIA